MPITTELQVRLGWPGGERPAWMPVAGVLAGAGWGSNQVTPMLLVYHARLGLSTTTLEALFAAYAVGLIRACCSPGAGLTSTAGARSGSEPPRCHCSPARA